MLEISTLKLAQIVYFGHELDRAENELRAFIETLNEDECASLIAVMWIGRETFAPENYAEAVSTARQEAVTPTVDYLIGTPHFSDHIEAGMELLGYSASEAEEAIL